MGSGHSLFRSGNGGTEDHIRPTAEQRHNNAPNAFMSLVRTSSSKVAKLSFKRKSRLKEKIKVFRELITTWPTHDVDLLLQEYETLRILKSLNDLAVDARAPVNDIVDDFNNILTSFSLQTSHGSSISICKTLVFARCRSGPFRELISKSAETPINVSNVLGETLFEDAVSLINSGKCSNSQSDVETLCDRLGIVNTLSDDLELAYQRSQSYGNFTIILKTADIECSQSDDEFRFRCDRDIICARSKLLFNLLTANERLDQIVLDEKILPRAYASLILYFIYTDNLDFSKISDTCSAPSSLVEARAIVAGRPPSVHRAIQVFHIAKFFELHRLCQLCEDVIVRALTTTSCASIVAWAVDNGSAYVARKAYAFIAEDFSRIAQSTQLFDLTESTLVEGICSHFIQAPEIEIVDAVIRWAEHELLRRMEVREPNIVAETCHSISRRGVKRSEMDATELKSIIAPFVPHLRIDYVLPPFHAILNSAYKRGILDRAPLRPCSSTTDLNPDVHWFLPDQTVPGPRLFYTYVEVVKIAVGASGERTLSKRPGAKLAFDVLNCSAEILPEENFAKIREQVTRRIVDVNAMLNIHSFPRSFHRILAVQLICLQVLRELGVDERSVEVKLHDSSEDLLSVSQVPDVAML